MKSIILVIVALIFVSFSLANVEVRQIDPSNPIANQYIFVFHEDLSEGQRGSFMSSLYKKFAADKVFDNKIIEVFNIGTFFGFAALLSDAIIAEAQKATDIIKYIEQDAVIKAFQSCNLQTNAPWGVDRISEQEINLDGQYSYGSTAGQGVDSYIVDTGILITHNDFGGRAIWGANYVDNTNTDCNGHGTHVAGTVGGTTYGVAKKTTLIAVKVLACNGSGSYAGVISGVQYVVTSYQSRKNPSVANMSLGGPISTALDDAIAAAVDAGVTFVVAAGNSNADACQYSPANEPAAISVGATGTDDSDGTEIDNRAYFSNYGKCTNIFAPGLMIQSAWITSNTAINTISGTSMAAPHVCGAVAMYLGYNPTSTPADVESYLLSIASNGIVDLDCNGASNPNSCNISPNAFLFSPCAAI